MGLLGILLGLGLLVWLAFRGWSILLLTPIAALIAAAFAGEPLLAHWTQTFMGSAAAFVAQFFPLFLLGAVFGKLMDDSGSVSAIARWMTGRLGERRAMLAVVLAGAFHLWRRQHVRRLLRPRPNGAGDVSRGRHPAPADPGRDHPRHLHLHHVRPAGDAGGAERHPHAVLRHHALRGAGSRRPGQRGDAGLRPVVARPAGGGGAPRRRGLRRRAGGAGGRSGAGPPAAGAGDHRAGVRPRRDPARGAQRRRTALRHRGPAAGRRRRRQPGDVHAGAAASRHRLPGRAALGRDLDRRGGRHLVGADRACRGHPDPDPRQSRPAARAARHAGRRRERLRAADPERREPGRVRLGRGGAARLRAGARMGARHRRRAAGLARGGHQHPRRPHRLGLGRHDHRARRAGAHLHGAHRRAGDRPGLLHRVAVMAAGALDTLPHNGAVVTLLAVSGCTHRESYGDVVVAGILGPILALAAVIVLGSLLGYS